MQHSLNEIEEQLKETSKISNQYLNAKIKKTLARWTLVALAFTLCWHYIPSIKWSLLILLPLAFIGLWRPLYTKYVLSKQMDDIRDTIDDINGE